MAYTGTMIEWPLAVDGQYGIPRPPITGMLALRNCTLDRNQLEKEGGATRQNAAALADDVRALYDWWPNPTTQRMIAVLDNGAVLRDAGTWTFPTTVIAAGGLTVASRPPHLVAGGNEAPGNARKLFCFTGNDAVRVGSGDFTTMTTISTPPADWTGARQPTCGVIHEGRLWAALEHTVYYSTTADHENLTGSGSGSIPIYPGEGQEIRTLISFRKMLIVFKYPTGIYIVDTSSTTPANWRVDPQSRALGSGGPYTALVVPNDVLFLDSEVNFHLLSATNVERDAASSDISTPKLGPWVREQLDANRIAWAQLAWYGDQKQVLAAVAALGSVTNNRRIRIDFNNPTVGPRFMYSDRDVQQALTMRLVSGIERPYIGTDDGYVVRIDESTRSKDGAGYTALWQTDHTDLGELVPEWRNKRKNFDFVEFEIEGTGAYTMNLNVYIDGELKTATPLSLSLAGAGVPLGTFQLDVDRLQGPVTTRRRRRLSWSGTRIGFEGSLSGVAQNFRINRAFIGARTAE